ncbi:sigma-70 family RNA polymerase sigma factor [Staphylococcus shinii]|jgi:RNA polymerase sporulation-specific sigma factor|uniref:sigma-70 family RNA polymerase sigma factor n=1 Tax=Staphylococcus shinii TaxID=2912228 RepID=UPI00298EE326|nr:sigma-70 family RNA polymerase sigma factor [Staphylococcus shinii]MDW8570158.1 sigma-70 family RNA polymerase sigma factor [Staphylococcus shinii]MDW8573933.1 sigma-70 family RNA polymerase sigma factor [Staphylococcus shinii]
MLEQNNNDFTSLKNSAQITFEKQELPKIFTTLMPLIRRRLKHFSIHPNDQEDLCQEVLIKLYQAFKHFDFKDTTPIEHYVNRVIKNVKNDYIRKKFYGYEIQTLLINEFIVSYNNNKMEHPIDKHILAIEVGEHIQQCMLKLTKLERMVIIYLLKDYKPKEIAQLLKLEKKVVYNAIHRCKIKLRHHIDD